MSDENNLSSQESIEESKTGNTPPKAASSLPNPEAALPLAS